MLYQSLVTAKDVKSCPTAALSDKRHDSMSRGNALAPKQTQLSAMHSKDLKTKVMQSKGWLSALIEI